MSNIKTALSCSNSNLSENEELLKEFSNVLLIIHTLKAQTLIGKIGGNLEKVDFPIRIEDRHLVSDFKFLRTSIPFPIKQEPFSSMHESEPRSQFALATSDGEILFFEARHHQIPSHFEMQEAKPFMSADLSLAAQEVTRSNYVVHRPEYSI